MSGHSPRFSERKHSNRRSIFTASTPAIPSTHLGRRFQMTLTVDPQGAAGLLERGLEPDAGQHVEQPAIRAAVAYVVGRDNWDSRRTRKRCELAIEALLTGVEMALQID